MRKLLLLFSILMMICQTAFAQVWVNGYYRSNGTYVEGHYRSSPNSTVRDNYSYKGNINPYTGKVGTNYYRNNPTSEYYNGYKYKPLTPKQYNHQSWSFQARKLIEKTLKAKGYDPGPIDGVMDIRCIKAIRRFQANNSLNVDGKVGDLTLNRLGLVRKN